MKKPCTLMISFLLLMFSLTLCSLTEASCFWRIKQYEDDDGDLWTDCYFSLFTYPGLIDEDFYNTLLDFKIPTQKYDLILILLFATDEINRNPYLLPNMSLILTFPIGMCFDTLKIIDKEIYPKRINSTFPNYECVSPGCDIQLIGPSWAVSLKLTMFSSSPKIFFGPFHPILSNSVQFPHVYQIAQKDTCLPYVMVSLMLHFTWNWIGLFILDNDQGTQFFSDLRKEMHSNEVCLAFVNVIPDSLQIYRTRAAIYDTQIITSSANVFIIYGEINSILEAFFRRWVYLGAQRIWVTTSQWDVIPNKRDFSLDSFHGTVTFTHHHIEIPKFRNFMKTMNTSKYPVDISQMRQKWNYFNCSISNTNYSSMNHCSFNNSWEWLSQHNFDMVLSEEGYNLYNAVYAVAHTYEEVILQQIESQETAENIGIFYDCKKMASLLKKKVFTNPVGELVNMNRRESLCAEYDIFNILNFPQGFGLKMKIGGYSPYFPQNQQLHISEDLMQAMGQTPVPTSTCSMICTPGFRRFHREQTAECCFDCVQCPENEVSNETDLEHCVKCLHDEYANTEHTHCLKKDVSYLAYEDPLGMALACMSLWFSLLTSLVFGIFVKYKDTPIVKANNRNLSYILLISITFCFLCSLLFIGYPNMCTCILQQTTFGVFFTVALSTVLAKTITVVMAFKITTPRRMRLMLVSGGPNFVIPLCTLIQLVLYGIWLATSPPFIDMDTHSEHGQIIIVCNKGSVIAFHFVLGYLGSLALGSFTVAFLARNLPDRFNEAKFLTFSMLVFFSVWATFLPVYHSTKGKAMVAVEVFSIVASSAGLLVCIFIPKCYVILIRPDLYSLYNYRTKLLH